MTTVVPGKCLAPTPTILHLLSHLVFPYRRTFAAQGSIECRACDPGMIASERSSSFCTNCEAGKYSNDEVTECLDCVVGRYSSVASSVCTKCDQGQIASQRSSSFCTNCKADKHSNNELMECLDCVVGRYSSAASSSCMLCSPGKFVNEIGQDFCENCLDYQESDAGATECHCKSTFKNDTTTDELKCLCDAGYTLTNGQCKSSAQILLGSYTSRPSLCSFSLQAPCVPPDPSRRTKAWRPIA